MKQAGKKSRTSLRSICHDFLSLFFTSVCYNVSKKVEFYPELRIKESRFGWNVNVGEMAIESESKTKRKKNVVWCVY